jgi:hypothetical protein
MSRSNVSALWFVDQAETLIVAVSLGRDAGECRHLAGRKLRCIGRRVSRMACRIPGRPFD